MIRTLVVALLVSVFALACGGAQMPDVNADDAMNAAKDPNAAADEAKAAATDAAKPETVAVSEKLDAYLSAMDGSADWAKVEPLFEDLFHADLVIVTANGEKNREQWGDAVKQMLGKAPTVSGYESNGHMGDAFLYKVTITLGDGTVLSPASKGMVKEGKLVRVEPVDPSVYSELSGATGEATEAVK